jgi:hypothetical protein
MDEKISASTSPTVTSAFEKDDDIEAQIQGEKTGMSSLPLPTCSLTFYKRDGFIQAVSGHFLQMMR